MEGYPESMSSHGSPPPLQDSSEDEDSGPPPLVDSSSEDEALDPFILAVMREDLESIEAMLVGGARSLNRACFHATGSQQRMTSLEYAVHRGAVPLAQLLFAHGARSRFAHGAAGLVERLQDLVPSTPLPGFCMHGFICLLRAATGEDPNANLDLLRAVQAGLGSATSNMVRSRLRFMCLCLMRLRIRGGSMQVILIHVLLDCITACLLQGRFVSADLHSLPEADNNDSSTTPEAEVNDSSTTPHTYLEFPVAWNSDWGIEVSNVLQEYRLSPENEGAQFFITTKYNFVWSLKDGTVPSESDFPLIVHILDEHDEGSSSGSQLVEATPAACPLVFSPPSFSVAYRPEPTRLVEHPIDHIKVPWSRDWGLLLSRAVEDLGMGLQDEGSRFNIRISVGEHFSLRDREVPGRNEFPLSLHMINHLWIMDETGSYELEVGADLTGWPELRAGSKVRGRLMNIHNRFARFNGSVPHAATGLDAGGSLDASQRQQAMVVAVPMASSQGGPLAASDPSLSVTQEMTHDEPAAHISPEEAQLITQQVEADLIQQSISPTFGHLQTACARNILAEDESNLSVSESVATSEPASEDDFFSEELQSLSFEDEDTHVSMNRLVLLNFTRHPPSFERALKSGEFDALREQQEALRRAGHPEVLPCGTKVFVSPEDFPLAREAVVGKKLGPSCVIVSEELEPVVQAAVNSTTKHRENVRVKDSETLGYGNGDGDGLVVRKTFLDLPDDRLKTHSVAHSTTAVHGYLNLNPRNFV